MKYKDFTGSIESSDEDDCLFGKVQGLEGSKTGLDEAIEDIKAGRVTHYESVEDFFKEMGV